MVVNSSNNNLPLKPQALIFLLRRVEINHTSRFSKTRKPTNSQCKITQLQVQLRNLAPLKLTQKLAPESINLKRNFLNYFQINSNS